jgi:hypothetical protein
MTLHYTARDFINFMNNFLSGNFIDKNKYDTNQIEFFSSFLTDTIELEHDLHKINFTKFVLTTKQIISFVLFLMDCGLDLFNTSIYSYPIINVIKFDKSDNTSDDFKILMNRVFSTYSAKKILFVYKKDKNIDTSLLTYMAIHNSYTSIPLFVKYLVDLSNLNEKNNKIITYYINLLPKYDACFGIVNRPGFIDRLIYSKIDDHKIISIIKSLIPLGLDLKTITDGFCSIDRSVEELRLDLTEYLLQLPLKLKPTGVVNILNDPEYIGRYGTRPYIKLHCRTFINDLEIYYANSSALMILLARIIKSVEIQSNDNILIDQVVQMIKLLQKFDAIDYNFKLFNGSNYLDAAMATKEKLIIELFDKNNSI